MKKEIFDVIKNNKPRVAIGVLLAGLALSQADIQFNEYSTLEQMREKDNTPTNRYRIDYGGKVAWLKDTQTGSTWDYQGKEQCLSNTPYAEHKSFQYLDKYNVLHVQTVKQSPDLKFSGIDDTSKRLAPADAFTVNFLNAHECQVSDY